MAQAEETLAMSREEQIATKKKNEADKATLKQVMKNWSSKRLSFVSKFASPNQKMFVLKAMTEVRKNAAPSRNNAYFYNAYFS